jgi:hypothetical protein
MTSAAGRRAPRAVALRAAVVASALLSNACLVLALQPVYDDSSVVVEDKLLGQWENADDQTRLTIERGEWRSYRIAYTERGSTRTLNANLTTIGDALFADVTEMRGADPGPYLIPVHGIFRVTLHDDELAIVPLDFDWFTRAVTDKRRGLPALAIDDRRNVIMTAPTAELRRWLARAPDAAFSAPMTFTR